MSFEIHQQNELLWLSSPLLDGCSGIRHGFSTRKGGVSLPPRDSLNLRTGCGDAPDALRENYRRFCAAVGTDVERTVLSRQVHETTVRVCTAADALVTNEPDLPLLVFSADCGIILLYDPSSRSIGAVHAGWRGCAAGIVEKTVQTMVREYGARPETVLAAVGPCIGRCCFETDGDVPEAMVEVYGPEAEVFIEKRGEKYYLDLKAINALALRRAGVEHIDISDVCTYCQCDRFWSHRASHGKRGSQGALICCKEVCR